MIITSAEYARAIQTGGTGFPAGILVRMGKQSIARTDDGFAPFIARELEATAIKVLEVPLTDLPLIGGAVLPINTAIPEGATSFTYVVEDGSGIAAWYDDYAAGSMPMVSATAEEFQRPIRDFALGWEMSVRDMRSSAFAGRGDLGTKLGNRALRGMREFHEAVGMFGDASRGMQGYANHPNVPIIAPTFDVTLTTSSWRLKEGDLIQADIVAMKEQVDDVTNSSRAINRIMIPRRVWTSLDRPYQVTGATNIAINSKSIMQFIVEANPEIQFGSLIRLQSNKSNAPSLTPEAPGTLQLANDRVVATTNTDEVLEYIQPISPRFLPPQWFEMKMKNPGYSSTGGTVIYEPFANVYMDVN